MNCTEVLNFPHLKREQKRPPITEAERRSEMLVTASELVLLVRPSGQICSSLVMISKLIEVTNDSLQQQIACGSASFITSGQDTSLIL
jgi:hypothetical protein